MRFAHALVLVSLAAVIAAPIAPSSGPVLSYTGCFDPGRHDKQISELAVGELPAHPCGHHDEQIHLSGGDLTGLTAGVGLDGGGDNGELSLAIAPGYRMPQGCASGEVPGWNGAAWACLDPASQAEFDAYKALLASAGTINDPQNPLQWTKLKGVPPVFADGSDDAGGPAGGDLTGSYPNPELAGSSVGTAELVDGALTGPKLADSAVTTAKLADSAVTSARIFDSTVLLIDLAFDPATQAELDALAQPGTINAPADPVDWTKLKSVPERLADGIDNVNERPGVPAPTGIEATGLGGDTASATVGADGLGLISFRGGFDTPYHGLAVSHCQNLACSQRTTALLDGPGNIGFESSIAIGADGLGLISYPGHLHTAHCSNVACSSATLADIDSVAVGGTALAIGADGLGLISYFATGPDDLKVAHCSNTACSAATTTTIDSSGNVSSRTSIALGTDGLGLISYSRDGLRIAHCSNVDCSEARTTVIDPVLSWNNSITVGADGLGLIGYRDIMSETLKVAHCSNVSCSTATVTTLDGTGTGKGVSITIGADGLGLISYWQGTQRVKIAHCSNVECTGATTTEVARIAVPWLDEFDSSITLGADGVGLATYIDFLSQGGIKVVHCANTFCIPYFRRR